MNHETVASPPKRPMPAIIHGLSRAEYDLIDRMNWSRLKIMAKSPAHYRHSLVAPEPEKTDALVTGNATHVLTFEPESFRARFAVWTEGRRAGAEWKAFCKANAGRDIVTEAQSLEARTLATAVRNDPTAAKYVTGGRGEVTVTWSQTLAAFAGMPETRIDCKARLDFVANFGCIVDLKTAKDGSPNAFGRQAFSLGYYGQAAWYSDGYAAATGTRLPFVFVVVEKAPPHIVTVYRVPDVVLELGREHYRAQLERYVMCRTESRWPGYSPDGAELELALPKWAMPFDAEEDLTGMDLVIDGQET